MEKLKRKKPLSSIESLKAVQLDCWSPVDSLERINGGKVNNNYNKKDGYRQQNVRQRHKLISIIDYDVCILEYLQPFWRFST